jgi:3-oxoacyl-[acyl-carrier protein] reductase
MMSQKEFTGKIILITGASRQKGIGAETARKFAKEGAEAIVITSRQESAANAKKLITELEQLGAKALWIPGDLSDPNTPQKIMQQIKTEFRRIDVIVNNAGIKIDKPINAITAQDWDMVMNINLRSAYLIIRESVLLFPRKEGGAIVNTSSIVGKYGNTGQANYAAAKAGLIGLTNASSIDLGRRNIRVNAVLPGFVETDMTNDLGDNFKQVLMDATPLGRLGTPGDIANAIVFLASSRASFITGQTIAIDGGLDGGIIGIAGLVRAGYKKG